VLLIVNKTFIYRCATLKPDFPIDGSSAFDTVTIKSLTLIKQ